MNPPARVVFSRPRKERRVFSVTPTDDAILKALGRYTYLEVRQLARLVPKSQQPQRRGADRQPVRPDPHRYLQQRAKLLLEAGFVRRRYLPPAAPPGKAPAMYWLDKPGADYVRSLEFPVIAAPKASDV